MGKKEKKIKSTDLTFQTSKHDGIGRYDIMGVDLMMKNF